MAAAAPIPSSESDTIGDFTVEDIRDHRFNHKKMRTEFNMKWKGYEKEENSWEPLENVYKCPILLENMEKRKRASLAKPLSKIKASKIVKEAVITTLPRFQSLGPDVIRKFKDPSEFVPRGTEIFGWLKSECISNDNDILWKVYFKASESTPDSNQKKMTVRYVRKSVMSYYWPVEAALFLTHLKHKEASVDHYLSSRE
jgi:hypothetical protein